MTPPVSRLPLTTAHIAVLQSRPPVKAAAPVAAATRKPPAMAPAAPAPTRPATDPSRIAAATAPASSAVVAAPPARPLQRGSLINILA